MGNRASQHKSKLNPLAMPLLLGCVLVVVALWLGSYPALAEIRVLSIGGNQTSTPPSSFASFRSELDSPTPTCVPRPVWSVVYSPNPSPTDSILLDVAAYSANDVWVVGRYNVNNQSATLIEHWDGTQWSVVPSPNPGNRTNILSGVTAITPNDVWAVGYSQISGPEQPLIEHWDGNQWSIVPSPNIEGGGVLRAVSATSANDVWAVGYYNYNTSAQTLTEHWGGNQWSVVVSPNTGIASTLWDVSAISSSDVWAVGEHGSGQGTLIEHWDGTQWGIVPSPDCPGGLENILNGVVAVTASDMWAVGECLGGQTLIEHWDGSQWSIVPSPNPDSYQRLYSVSAASAADVWAVGYFLYQNGSIAATLIVHWDGTSWTQVPSPNPGTQINSLEGVAAISADDVWAAGYLKNGGGPWQTLTEHYAPPPGQCASPSPSPSPSPSLSPSPTITASPTPTFTTTPITTPLPTFTATPTASPTLTPTSALLTTTPTATPAETPTACSISFTDVLPGSIFYPYVQCLACRGIINGYDDNTFRPNNDVTRGQLAKIVSNSAGFSDPQTTQLFEDVPPGPDSTFFVFIGRLASRGYMSGYPCGGEGEPCVKPDNLPYFRPFNNATRGQISKIVANTAGYGDPPGDQIFEDVAPDHTFYDFIQRLASRGHMSGYPCGGEGEPCVEPGNRPYFRPFNNATRGQTSKIVSNTFFSGCNPSQR